MRTWLAACLLLAGCDRVLLLRPVEDRPDGGGSSDVGPDGVGMAGLVAHYPMEEVSNGTVVDVVGGHDGNCTSCPSPVAGVVGGALVFQPSDLVVVPPSTDFETVDGFTVSLWLRLETAPSASVCAIGKVLTTADSNTWQLCADPGHVLDAYFTSTSVLKVTGPTIAEDTWYHVALRWDRMTLALFLAGNEAASLAALPKFDGGEITFGGDLERGSPKWAWDGSLDDLQIYNRPLSDAEIAALAGN